MIDARTLAERVFAVIDGQRWADYETVMHPDVEMTSPFATLHSATDWADFSRSFAVAMPDGAHTVTRVVQAGDRFAFEGHWTGTHTGPLSTPGGEVPATGRAVTMPFCAVGTQRDGRLSSVSVYLDQLAMLAQLGLVPEPEPADRLAVAR
jgi:ketosteroid isomerase-like protein